MSQFLWLLESLYLAVVLSFVTGKFSSSFHMIVFQIFGNISRTILHLADFLISGKKSLSDLLIVPPIDDFQISYHLSYFPPNI